ncbi:outer membrane beta-barrel protein [Fluviicola chungangensis]|uniref:PorT family protein n=1 Tax=Fluviicola chungangensis TaxID=2597671 RepID=A0A556N3G9_9FLAO|nr:outer membrane beta-barrel protein [Fluviicola chungangensis]TSJ46730.1 PorT family protein [Fluviicola chungangensis]
MKQLAVLALLIFSPFANHAQISTGKVEDAKKKNATESGKADKDPSQKYDPDAGLMDFTAFIGAGYSIGSHKIETNEGLFGRPVGKRADENMINRWTYQVGVRNRIHRFWTFEAGLAIDRYGESYKYESTTSDSAYSYDRAYNMLALPIQMYFTYGKRVQFLAGAGIQPYIPLSMKTKTTILDSLGSDVSPEDAKTIEGLNSAGINLLFSAGIQYRFSRYFSAYLIPCYSLGLTNIYGKQEPHKEWLNALNIRFGMAVHFPESEKTRTKKEKDPKAKKVFQW